MLVLQKYTKFVEVYYKCSFEGYKDDSEGFGGEITNMMGIQDPYEASLNPEVVIDTEHDPINHNVQKILEKPAKLGYLT